MHRKLCVVLCAIALGSCAGGPTLFDRGSMKIGETICGKDYAEAGDTQTRMACVGFAVALASEIAVDRVTLYEPDRAGEALETVAKLREAFSALRNGTTDRWFGAELYDIERLMLRAGSRVLWRQIDAVDLTSVGLGTAAVAVAGGPAVAAAAAGGLATAVPKIWGGPGRYLVGTAGKTSAMIGDIRRMMVDLKAGTLTVDEIMVTITERLIENERRIKALVSAS